MKLAPQKDSKSSSIEKLLEKNKDALLAADATATTHSNGICYDGIVDEDVFDKQGKKIIFLLKETNGNDKHGNLAEELTDWDYRGWLQHKQADGGKSDDKEAKFYGKTLYNLCMWVDLFYRCYEDKKYNMPFDEYYKDCFDAELYRKVLKKTAIVNLKKTWGGGSTKWKDLNAYLENEVAQEVVREEIKIIDADYVICGGQEVFDFAKKIFGVADEGLKYFKCGNSVFLNFYHPSCRKTRESLYEEAVTCFKSLAGM